MKKKFFMLLAAVLLGSVSAMAQSGNNNPAKGDVNEDGMVDVADINAILKIMKDGGGPVAVGGYFYLGTTEPTAANYKSLPGAVTTFTSIDYAVGTTASVAAGETLYMLCPAAWVTEKNVALEDKSGNTIDFLDKIDAATISGHVIYKTQVWNAPNDVVLKTTTTYYWYAGQSNPANMTSITPILSGENEFTSGSGWHLIGSESDLPTSIDQLIKGGTSGKIWYAAIPVKAGLVAGSSSDPDTSVTQGSIVTIEEIQYQIWINEGTTGTRYGAQFGK